MMFNACFNSNSQVWVLSIINLGLAHRKFKFRDDCIAFLHILCIRLVVRQALTASCIIHYTSNNIAASLIQCTPVISTFCHVVDNNADDDEITTDADNIHMQCKLGQEITSAGKGHTSQD